MERARIGLMGEIPLPVNCDLDRGSADGTGVTFSFDAGRNVLISFEPRRPSRDISLDSRSCSDSLRSREFADVSLVGLELLHPICFGLIGFGWMGISWIVKVVVFFVFEVMRKVIELKYRNKKDPLLYVWDDYEREFNAVELV